MRFVRRVIPLSIVLCLVVAVCACPSRRNGPRPHAPRHPRRPDVEAILAQHEVPWDPAVRADTIRAGREAFVRLDCVRCHTIDDVPAAPLAENCTGCHATLAGLTPGPREDALRSEYGADTMRRYREHVAHFIEVPDLTGLGRRIRPAWIAGFVMAPHDLRPMLEESMPRIAAQTKDAMVVARYFAAMARSTDPAISPDDPQLGPRPSDANIARGAALFRERGCNTCHTIGNVETGKTIAELEAGGIAARLAPNLRFARLRMHRDIVEAWIRAPRDFHPSTRMRDLQISPEDAARLADFILFVDPRLLPVAKPPDFELPPAAQRPVTWEEVRARVFEPACVPCHMNDHERDPGPGNIGGFGWHAEHVQFRTYEGLVRGAGSGQYAFSILMTREGEEMPPVLEHMMIRRIENGADHILPFADHEPLAHGQDEPGMPMGMPAISDENIGLVRAWLDQGCPGPVAVTGMPGVTDGYRVPDGPITRNRGCERRDPESPRPTWASDRDAGPP